MIAYASIDNNTRLVLEHSSYTLLMNFDLNYYLAFGHHNDNIGTVTRNIDLIKQSKHVLVVPCGYGQIVNWCLSEGISCVGYDINFYLIQIIQKQLVGKIFLNDIRYMQCQDRKFDLIICCDLLEHLNEQDIMISLRNILDHLETNGKVILRISTEEMPEFENDPTHKTKKSSNWWKQFVVANGFYIKKETILGEMILLRRKE